MIDWRIAVLCVLLTMVASWIFGFRRALRMEDTAKAAIWAGLNRIRFALERQEPDFRMAHDAWRDVVENVPRAFWEKGTRMPETNYQELMERANALRDD